MSLHTSAAAFPRSSLPTALFLCSSVSLPPGFTAELQHPAFSSPPPPPLHPPLLRPISSSRGKCVCDTISTPEIIPAVPNVAGRVGGGSSLREREGEEQRGREGGKELSGAFEQEPAAVNSPTGKSQHAELRGCTEPDPGLTPRAASCSWFVFNALIQEGLQNALTLARRRSSSRREIRASCAAPWRLWCRAPDRGSLSYRQLAAGETSRRVPALRLLTAEPVKPHYHVLTPRLAPGADDRWLRARTGGRKASSSCLSPSSDTSRARSGPNATLFNKLSINAE
ncbi:unnamed protein product [Pleuronectes platessa]|uniref:Uncharacterized protein n=1 Tax=Pleuronectes platessa TaxID=8262 RepID=A0A9N7U492_PLEPL|nr:unnamed protein product [Pleuronectes platessa]